MAKPGPKPGGQKTPGSGRKKGTPNKVTKSVKAAVFDAFVALGGAEEMHRWAKRSNQNQIEFYKIAARLIPTEVAGAGGGALLVQVVTESGAQEPAPSETPPAGEEGGS